MKERRIAVGLDKTMLRKLSASIASNLGYRPDAHHWAARLPQLQGHFRRSKYENGLRVFYAAFVLMLAAVPQLAPGRVDRSDPIILVSMFRQLYRRAQLGFWISALAPSVLFAAAHLYQSDNLMEQIGILAITGTGGIGFCWFFMHEQYGDTRWVVLLQKVDARSDAENEVVRCPQAGPDVLSAESRIGQGRDFSRGRRCGKTRRHLRVVAEQPLFMPLVQLAKNAAAEQKRGQQGKQSKPVHAETRAAMSARHLCAVSSSLSTFATGTLGRNNASLTDPVS